jgi:hypothetical protein
LEKRGFWKRELSKNKKMQQEAWEYAYSVVSRLENDLARAKSLRRMVMAHACDEPGCSARLATPGDLRVHKEQHGKASHECLLCGKCFLGAHDLRRHVSCERHRVLRLLETVSNYNGVNP